MLRMHKNLEDEEPAPSETPTLAKKILPFNTGDAIGCLGLVALAWMQYGKRFPLAEQQMEGDQF